MKKIIGLLLILLLLASACKKSKQTVSIHLNQLGYYPQAIKRAIIANSDESSFEILDTSGIIVFKGNLTNESYWDKSGEKLKIADFSEFTTKGTYVLSIKDAPLSASFQIKENLYKEAFKASLKNYYYIRASIEIKEKYAGKWKRKMGHPDTLCYLHPSTERSNETINSRGGWYDAGDYNKYIVNGGVSVGTILNFYEMYPDIVTDGFSNIPESGNGFSDLLDEVKYELDWVLSMQAPDGASHFKLTSKGFPGFIMPDNDTTSRFVVGKSTASSLNFAAMTAQASRLYQQYDAGFAARCLEAAKKAWKWSVKNPKVIFKNPKDVQTGEYSDSTFTEEFWWAASELYLASKDQKYLDYISNNEPYVAMKIGESWRQFLGNIGSFSLILAEKGSPTELKEKITTQLIKLADSLLIKLESIPYRIAVDDFQWGSNSDILNSAIIFVYAYKLSGEQKYLDATIETVDYIFGKNATGYSFFTGFGSKSSMNIHNRPSGADGVDDPIPGFIVGGPNNNREDDIAKTEWGVSYTNKFPAKSYVDIQGSYASNENCINWNAPAVFVLGFLEANSNKLQ